VQSQPEPYSAAEHLALQARQARPAVHRRLLADVDAVDAGPLVHQARRSQADAAQEADVEPLARPDRRSLQSQPRITMPC
jgi:hypothetical protein